MNMTTVVEWFSAINAKLSLRTKLELSVVAVFLAALWYVAVPAKPEVGVWNNAKPASEVAHVGTTEVPCTKLVVLEPKAKEKLKLPAAVVNDPNIHVAGTTDVKPGEHTTTVISTVDTTTGQTTIMTRVDPYPWFKAQHRGEIRADIGTKNAGNIVGRFTLHEDVVQIKGVNVGVNLSADTDRAFFLGAGAGYRW
jgi:hypothetical protein